MRILYLQKRPLFPIDTGGRVRTLNIVRELARSHEVTYLCNVQAGEQDAVAQMAALGLRMETVPWRETGRGSWRFYAELAGNLLSPVPYNVAKDTDRRLRRRAQQLLDREAYDLVICDFVQMAANAVGLEGPPMLLFQHNVEAEIFERHAAQDRSVLRRAYMGYQAQKMRRFEAEAGRQFNTVIAVSDRDRRQFEQRYGWSHVRTIDTAVDVDFFQPDGGPTDPNLVSFIGSMDWLPNIDGVQFLMERIWTRVRATRPEARLQIVGRHPTAEVGQYHGADGVEVTGGVPDVRPYYSKSAVVVVPLRIGGGTRIKIYEAMAMAKPVVSTSLGAEGLAFVDGAQIELADAPDLFAKRIIELLSDGEKRDRIGRAARQHVCENFTTAIVARQFEAICLATARMSNFGREADSRSRTTMAACGTSCTEG